MSARIMMPFSKLSSGALALQAILLLAGCRCEGSALDSAEGPTKGQATRTAPVLGTDPTNVLGRIIVIGASASAGFTATEPFGGPTTPQYRLSRYVDAAIKVPHEPVRNVASTLFFMQPEAEAQRQIELALEYKPTLVLGADFLFWFCYGDGRIDRDRLKRFEAGLKLCESLQCPLVLGDIPDASGAVNGMLSPDEIPSHAAIASANAHLKSWAAKHPNVAVLSLSNFMATVVGDSALTVHGYALAKRTTSSLLQPDRLHPSPPGSAVLALLTLDAFRSHTLLEFGRGIRWDPKEVFRLGIVSSPTANPGSPQRPKGTKP